MRPLPMTCSLALLLAACATHRDTIYNRGTRVAAPAHHTRTAVMEAFAEKQIPVAEDGETQRLLRQGSDARIVTIVSDTIRLDTPPHGLAECATSLGTSASPDAAVYRVEFAGDSSATSLFTDVVFTRRDPSTGERQRCKSLRVWEHQLESYVKLHAERRR